MTDNPPVTSQESAKRSLEERLQQAPVKPVPDDGVRVFSIGTAFFVVGYVALQLARVRWGVPDWWYTVALPGIGIGLIAIGYCAWRRKKRARDAAHGIPAPTP